MNGLRLDFAGVSLLAALAVPGAVEASTVRLGLGAHHWQDHGGLFQLNLGVETPLVSTASVGLRFGALVASRSETFGVPLDVVLRATFARRQFYVEGMGGPWILFKDDPVHAHAAFGFGVQGAQVSLGLEVGYLEPSAMVGLRLAYRL